MILLLLLSVNAMAETLNCDSSTNPKCSWEGNFDLSKPYIGNPPSTLIKIKTKTKPQETYQVGGVSFKEGDHDLKTGKEWQCTRWELR